MTMPTTLATAAPASPDSPAGLLAEITADLSSGADIRALQHFLAPIVQIAQARAGAVRMLFDDDQLRLVGELSLPPQLGCGGASVHRHCGGCGRAVDGDELAWDPDMSGCSPASRDTLAPMGWAHMLAVPLGHRGQVLGVYNLFFDATQVPSDDVRSVLRSIGELLGLALHNARLESENLRATVMQERQMMAAEVHDSVAQDLAFLRMRLPLLEQAIGEHDEGLTARYLTELRQALGHAHGSLREIVTEFRTPTDPLGLAHALRARVDEFAARSGLHATLDNRLPTLALPAAHETQVVHIVGEALVNVARHAAASQARVSVQREGGEVAIRITDNGAGPPTTAAERGHHGLEIMAERARRMGGVLALQANEGGGTVVALRFPAPWLTERHQ